MRWHPERLSEPCLQLQHPHAPLAGMSVCRPISQMWRPGLWHGGAAYWARMDPPSHAPLAGPIPVTFCRSSSHRFDDAGKTESRFPNILSVHVCIFLVSVAIREAQKKNLGRGKLRLIWGTLSGKILAPFCQQESCKKNTKSCKEIAKNTKFPQGNAHAHMLSLAISATTWKCVAASARNCHT